MKTLKKANIVIAIFLAVLTFVLAFTSKEYSILLYWLLIPLPFILKVKPLLTTLYLFFTSTSILLGSQYHLYKKTVWFDSFSHFSWGVLSSLMAIWILDKFGMYHEKKIWFNTLFIFVFSLATSGFWEICEFFIDAVLGIDMQRDLTSGVFDTMKDMIVAFIGNILFLAWYGYEYLDNHNGLIKRFVHNMNKN